MITPGKDVAVINGEAVEAKGVAAGMAAEMAAEAVSEEDNIICRERPTSKGTHKTWTEKNPVSRETSDHKRLSVTIDKLSHCVFFYI